MNRCAKCPWWGLKHVVGVLAVMMLLTQSVWSFFPFECETGVLIDSTFNRVGASGNQGAAGDEADPIGEDGCNGGNGGNLEVTAKYVHISGRLGPLDMSGGSAGSGGQPYNETAVAFGAAGASGGRGGDGGTLTIFCDVLYFEDNAVIVLRGGAGGNGGNGMDNRTADGTSSVFVAGNGGIGGNGGNHGALIIRACEIVGQATVDARGGNGGSGGGGGNVVCEFMPVGMAPGTAGNGGNGGDAGCYANGGFSHFTFVTSPVPVGGSGGAGGLAPQMGADGTPGAAPQTCQMGPECVRSPIQKTCEDAVPLPVGFSTGVVELGCSGGGTLIGGTIGSAAWWKINDTGQLATISFNTSCTSHRLMVFRFDGTGSCPGEKIAEAVGTATNPAQVTVRLDKMPLPTEGGMYYVAGVVEGSGLLGGEFFMLDVTLGPVNDLPSGAISLDPAGQTVAGPLTFRATASSVSEWPLPNAADVWYAIPTPTACTQVTATFIHGSNQGAVTLFSGSDGNSLDLRASGTSNSPSQPAEASMVSSESDSRVWIRIAANASSEQQTLFVTCQVLEGSSYSNPMPVVCGGSYSGPDGGGTVIPGSSTQRLPSFPENLDVTAHWLLLDVPPGSSFSIDAEGGDRPVSIFLSCGEAQIEATSERSGVASIGYQYIGSEPIQAWIWVNHASDDPYWYVNISCNF